MPRRFALGETTASLFGQYRNRLTVNGLGISRASGKGSIWPSPCGTFRGGYDLRNDPAVERSHAHAHRRRTHRQARPRHHARAAKLRPGHRPGPRHLLEPRRAAPGRCRPGATDPSGRGDHLPGCPDDGTGPAAVVPGRLRRWRRGADADDPRRDVPTSHRRSCPGSTSPGPGPTSPIFGEVTIERVGYGHDRLDAAPLDARLHLPRRQYSHLLQKWLGAFVIDDAHAEAVRKLRMILGITIPVKASEDLNREQASDVEPFQDRLPVPEPSPGGSRLVVVTCRLQGRAVDPLGSGRRRVGGGGPGNGHLVRAAPSPGQG